MLIGLIKRLLLLGIGVSGSPSLGIQDYGQDGINSIAQQPIVITAAEKWHNSFGSCAMNGPLNAFEGRDPSRRSFGVPSPPLDIRPLIVSGPVANRVDLVFFSDGYTTDETEKFFEDAKRLADDVSQNQTFYTVKPLLNFWGAFTPSEESGIGVGGVPKKTPYGLYRDGTELRAVYYDKPEAAHAACDSMKEQCDFPILLGNDPLYGGLGGEFTVVTSSILNGPLVLRHELGHSIIDVGEEYDGGFAYFGVNAAHNAAEPIPWSHWLSEVPPKKDAETQDDLNSTYKSMVSDHRIERSVMPMQAYPWTLLNTTQAWSINFTSSGAYSRHVVRFSLSGMPEAEDLRVELDGIDLKWLPKEGLGLDRWHYDVHRDGGLSGGEHELKFTLLKKELEGTAQMCSAEILEFGNEQEFTSSPGHYGLYPTFSDKNETSYRPTNEDCLMRIVTTPNFCKVCLEGLWLSLLKRINLIDGLTESCVRGTETGTQWLRSLNLDLIPLANLRETLGEKSFEPPDETYTVTWEKDGEVLDIFQDRTYINLNDAEAVGKYTIHVQFHTDEVRIDNEGRLASVLEYEITSLCQDI